MLYALGVDLTTNIGATNFWCTARATIQADSTTTNFFPFSLVNIFLFFLFNNLGTNLNNK